MELKNEKLTESEIRILILEDVLTDAEILRREIEQAGIGFISQIVDNQKNFLEALHNFKPDIILSDYMLPEFNGMLALRLTKEFDPSIPFILVTGSINEETAVECMKAGADDYVVKEHISAVSTAIKDALEKKQLRMEKEKSEEKLRRSEEQFRLIAENIADMIVVLDLEGKRVYNSPSYKDILGDTEALQGNDSFQDIHPEDREKIKKIFYETVKTGIGQRAEYRLIGKDGNIYFIESQGSVIKDENGKIVNVVVVSRDVTKRKMDEEMLREKEAFLNNIIENIPHLIYIKDAKDLRYVRLNKACELEWGFKREELIGKNDYDFFPENEAEFFNSKDKEVLKKKQLINIPEESVQTKFVGKRIMHTKKIPILDNNGNPQYLLGISEDITERKRSEEALYESEQRFRRLFSSSPDAIMLIDPTGSWPIIDCNDTACQMNGYTRKELIGKSVDIINISKGTPDERSAYLKRIRNEGVIKVETFHRHRDGHIFPIEVSTSIVNLKGRELILGIDRDITERKRAEEALNESEERFRILFTASPDAIMLLDTSDPSGYWPIVDCNDIACQMNGYTREELIGKPVDILNISVGTPEEHAAYLDRIRREGVMRFETFHRHRDGHIFPVEVSTSIVMFRGRELILGIDRDITERRKVEEALVQEQYLMNMLMDNVPDHIYFKDTDSRFIRINKDQARIFGFSNPIQAIGKTDFDFFTEEHARSAFDDEQTIIRTGKPIIGFEEKETWHDGRETWVSTTKMPLRDKEGNIIGTFGISHNITERKLIEQSLRESESKLREAQEMAHLGFWSWDVKSGDVEWSEEIFKIFGLDPKKFTPQIDSILALSPWPEDHQRDKELINKAIESHSPGSYEQKFLRSDQSIGYYYSTFQGKYGENGELISIVGTVLDITERKEADKALKESEEKFRTYIENSPVGIFVTDDKGNYIDANTAACNLINYSKEEILSMNIVDLLPQEEMEKGLKAFKRLSTEGKDFTELELKKKDNANIPITLDAVRLPDNKFMAFCSDITERKQAEKRINLLAHTVRSISECVSITDLNDIILFVNDAFLRTYGYTEDEILGKNIKIVRSPNNPPNIAVDIFDKARFAGWHGELLNQTKDGREFPTFLSTSIVHDDLGNAVALVGVASDITERKLAEQTLKESEERYRFIVEATSDVIYQIKYNSVVYDYINPTIEKLTGYTPEEINSIGFSIIIEKVKKLDSEKLKTNITPDIDEWRTDYQIRTKTGKLVWISDTSYPWLNKDGKPIGRIGILRDITDRIQAQEEIIKAKEKAEEMNRLKSSFLANMSHELRTPLIGILGYADILKDESKGKEQKEIAETILESGNRLSETLNLILDLSKVEAETLKVNYEEIELNEFVNNQVKSFNKTLRKKGVKLKMNLFKESVYTNLDEVLLNSVINNLVNNAIKYTDKGEVVISVKKVIEKDEELAEIIVKDTGIGISKENLDIIFEPFRQASEGYTRKFEGTGLGLTLVKKYVKNMNGEISVESEIGVGSEFKIRFPSMTTPTKKKLKSELKEIVKETEFEPGVSEKPLILYVEDDPTTRDVVKRYVDKYCYIDGISNGEEAVEFAKMKKYDLILMDISLGKGMSGLTAADKIKEIPGCENIPIVAVTAYALAGDRERFLEHGCTHYLPKPFIKEQLISLINDILKLELTK